MGHEGFLEPQLLLGGAEIPTEPFQALTTIPSLAGRSNVSSLPYSTSKTHKKGLKKKSFQSEDSCIFSLDFKSVGMEVFHEGFCRSVQKTDWWSKTPFGVKTPQPCSGTHQDMDCTSEQHFSRRGTIALTVGPHCQGCQGSCCPGPSHTSGMLPAPSSALKGKGRAVVFTTPLA